MEVVSLSDCRKPSRAGGKLRLPDNTSHSLQQFYTFHAHTSANVRQLTHKPPDKSAVVLINLFLWVVQAVNKVDR